MGVLKTYLCQQIANGCLFDLTNQNQRSVTGVWHAREAETDQYWSGILYCYWKAHRNLKTWTRQRGCQSWVLDLKSCCSYMVCINGHESLGTRDDKYYLVENNNVGVSLPYILLGVLLLYSNFLSPHRVHPLPAWRSTVLLNFNSWITDLFTLQHHSWKYKRSSQRSSL